MVAAVEHRITVSGGKSIGEVMTDEAAKTLYVASRGVPREVMKLANASLLLAAVNGVKPITEEIIKLSVENMMQTEEYVAEAAA
jgi:type II secretory pathway predicted ATPase ExeA